jgi:hypothetical protein
MAVQLQLNVKDAASLNVPGAYGLHNMGYAVLSTAELPTHKLQNVS